MAGPITLQQFPSRVSGFFLNYSSVREIEVRHTLVATIHRVLQLGVLAYVFL